MLKLKRPLPLVPALAVTFVSVIITAVLLAALANALGVPRQFAGGLVAGANTIVALGVWIFLRSDKAGYHEPGPGKP